MNGYLERFFESAGKISKAVVICERIDIGKKTFAELV